MKLISKIIFIFLFSLLLFIGCTVNEYTSKISITNKSNIYISNIKISDTVICALLAPGASFDYYFFTEMEGNYSCNEAISGGYSTNYSTNKYTVVERDGTYYLKPEGYYYNSEIFKRDGEYYITLNVDKHDFHYGEDDYDEYISEDFYTND